MSPPWKCRDARDLSALCISVPLCDVLANRAHTLRLTLHPARHATVIAVSQADVEGIDGKLIAESFGHKDELISNFPTSQNDNAHTVLIVSRSCAAPRSTRPPRHLELSRWMRTRCARGRSPQTRRHNMK